MVEVNREIRIKINTDQVSHSNLYKEYPAQNAIDGTDNCTYTNQGIGQWWKVKFGEEYRFTRIRIQNRTSHGFMLGKTNVMVSGKIVGSLPAETIENEWYEGYCDEAKGDEIKLVTTTRTNLSFQNIEVYGLCLGVPHILNDEEKHHNEIVEIQRKKMEIKEI